MGLALRHVARATQPLLSSAGLVASGSYGSNGHIGKPGRIAQRDQVTARDLVGIEPQSFSCDAALELRGKQKVVAAYQHLRWNGRPAREPAGCAIAAADGSRASADNHSALASSGRSWKKCPPVVGRFAGPRNHGIDQHDHLHWLAHHGRGEPTE